MDIIKKVNNIIPLPFLQSAFTIFNSIWASVEQVQAFQGQLGVLVAYAADLLAALDTLYRTEPIEQSTIQAILRHPDLVRFLATFFLQTVNNDI